MEKRASGEIRVHERKDGQVTYSLRFRVNGKREVLTLGTDTDGWTHRKAERKLDDVLARVRAGVWQPPAPPDEAPTAPRPSTCSRRAGGWPARASCVHAPRRTTNGGCASTCCRSSPTTRCPRSTSRWSSATARRRSSNASGSSRRRPRASRCVTSADSDACRSATTASTRRSSRSPRSSTARSSEAYWMSNPARGKRRRLKAVKPVRRQLEADDLKELLQVAGEMDRHLFRGHRIGRRPMIAAMAKSGLRVTEMCRLRWRDVDVHHERLVIGEAKTDAGNRHVDLSLDVMEELMAWRAECQPASADAYVFPTASGRPRDKENISRRVLGPTVEAGERAPRGPRDCPAAKGDAARAAADVHQPHDRGRRTTALRHEPGRARRLEHDARDLRPGAEAPQSQAGAPCVRRPPGQRGQRRDRRSDRPRRQDVAVVRPSERFGDAETASSGHPAGPRGPRSGPRT